MDIYTLFKLVVVAVLLLLMVAVIGVVAIGCMLYHSWLAISQRTAGRDSPTPTWQWGGSRYRIVQHQSPRRPDAPPAPPPKRP